MIINDNDPSIPGCIADWKEKSIRFILIPYLPGLFMSLWLTFKSL